MIAHVLDTDILSLLQYGHPQVAARCVSAAPGTLGITVISVEEQFLGWYTRIRQAKRDDELVRAYDGMTAFTSFVAQLPVLYFTAGAVQRYRQLLGLKTNVGKKDLRIAAIALEHSAAVVTRNAGDFSRVPGLVIEDWSQ